MFVWFFFCTPPLGFTYKEIYLAHIYVGYDIQLWNVEGNQTPPNCHRPSGLPGFVAVLRVRHTYLHTYIHTYIHACIHIYRPCVYTCTIHYTHILRHICMQTLLSDANLRFAHALTDSNSHTHTRAVTVTHNTQPILPHLQYRSIHPYLQRTFFSITSTIW